jgi:hypothetical protein
VGRKIPVYRRDWKVRCRRMVGVHSRIARVLSIRKDKMKVRREEI